MNSQTPAPSSNSLPLVLQLYPTPSHLQIFKIWLILSKVPCTKKIRLAEHIDRQDDDIVEVCGGPESAMTEELPTDLDIAIQTSYTFYVTGILYIIAKTPTKVSRKKSYKVQG